MHLIAEIQVAPSPPGTADDPHAHVEAAIAVIAASGLPYEVGALGTTRLHGTASWDTGSSSGLLSVAGLNMEGAETTRTCVPSARSSSAVFTASGTSEPVAMIVSSPSLKPSRT